MSNNPENGPSPTLLRRDLLDRAKEASTSPGVYLMKDVEGGVLYVGKAKNLRNRLISYFQAPVHEIPRIEMMVSRVERFEVILTGTESEALILECTLIKKHKPKFNVRLRDDKTYPYLKIQRGDSFPRIEWTRRVKQDGARYFGPFPSAASAREVLGLLNETFQLRDCSDNTFRHRTRPCILFQMGKCSAPCVGKVDARGYGATLDEVVAILEGRSDRLIGELRKGMEEAAEREDFEQAAWLRDRMQSLELVTATQVVADAGSDRHRDVVGLARDASEAHGVVLQIRHGKLVAVRHYQLQNVDSSLPERDLVGEFLTQFEWLQGALARDPESASGDSAGAESGAPEAKPDAVAAAGEILVPEAPEDYEVLERAVGAVIRTAATAAETQLLNVARANAKHSLEQRKKRAGGHGIEALEQVMEKLDLPRLPSRIECFDISNTQGEESVASRVVFIDGAPDKDLYRRYKIRTVIGANDFASMKEVLGRRFGNSEKNSDEELPDLVVVDGGKGQLAQAEAILDELGVQGVQVVGLAKARTERDFRAKEVDSSMERIFIPGRKNPVALLPHTPAYKLLTHVRDEAHRFAITYHRLLRGKRSLRREGE